MPHLRSYLAEGRQLAHDSLADARSCRTFLDGVEDRDTAEPRGRAAVRHRSDLTWLALAAVERTTEQIGLPATDAVHRAPEFGCRRLIGDIPDLAGQLTAPDPVETLPGELKVVPLHVDRPRLVTDDVDPVLDTADQIGGRAARRVRLQADVGHPLDRDVRRRIGVGAAIGTVETQPAGEHPVQLVAGEDPPADQIPGLPGDAVVVVPD